MIYLNEKFNCNTIKEKFKKKINTYTHAKADEKENSIL